MARQSHGSKHCGEKSNAGQCRSAESDGSIEAVRGPLLLLRELLLSYDGNSLGAESERR